VHNVGERPAESEVLGGVNLT